MTPKRLAAIAVLLAAGIGTGLLLRGGHSNPPVAHVGGDTITRDQLDTTVDHFREQAKQEGTPFPDEDSARFRFLRNRLVGVLVYRAELRQAARRLGIRVTNVQVLRRLQASSESEESGRDAFEYGSAESQLLYERIYAKVTRGIGQAAGRNDAMTRFVAGLADRLRQTSLDLAGQLLRGNEGEEQRHVWRDPERRVVRVLQPPLADDRLGLRDVDEHRRLPHGRRGSSPAS